MPSASALSISGLKAEAFRALLVKNRPLHVVTAEATDEATTVIITVYEPDPARWQPGFEKRK